MIRAFYPSDQLTDAGKESLAAAFLDYKERSGIVTRDYDPSDVVGKIAELEFDDQGVHLVIELVEGATISGRPALAGWLEPTPAIAEVTVVDTPFPQGPFSMFTEEPK